MRHRRRKVWHAVAAHRRRPPHRPHHPRLRLPPRQILTLLMLRVLRTLTTLTLLLRLLVLYRYMFILQRMILYNIYESTSLTKIYLSRSSTMQTSRNYFQNRHRARRRNNPIFRPSPCTALRLTTTINPWLITVSLCCLQFYLTLTAYFFKIST